MQAMSTVAPGLAELPAFSFVGSEYRGWDRYRTSARYREQEPGMALDELGRVWLFRYADAYEVALDKDRFRNMESAFAIALGFEPESPYRIFSQHQLITSNPPAHTRMRTASNHFARRLVRPLEPMIRERCDRLIDRFPDEGEVEFVREFAFKLPVSVIMSLLGLPESDEELIHELSPKLVPADTRPETRAEVDDANRRLREYAEATLEEHRRRPAADDIIAELANAEARGEILDDEAWALVISLLVAGHGTTTNTLGLAVHTLLQHRDQLERLRADRTLLPNAAEEILRYEPSLDGAPRIANEDVELNGISIPAETTVALSLASANRDPRQFQDGDRFDIGRRNARRHLSFGVGIHRCVGAPLAQLQLPVALDALLDRLETLEPAGEPELLDSTFRGLKTLPLYVKRKS